MLIAIAKEDAIDQALDALLTEAERVARFGFTPPNSSARRATSSRTYEQALRREGQARVRAARRRVRPQLPAGRAVPGPRARVRDAPAVPARHLAGRGEQPGARVDARREPRRGGERAAEAGLDGPGRGRAGGGDQGGGAEAIVAYVDTAPTARCLTRRRRRAPRRDTERGRRHHRVGAVQRRQGRAEADDLQAGRGRCSARSAREARRWRPTRTSCRPRPPRR